MFLQLQFSNDLDNGIGYVPKMTSDTEAAIWQLQYLMTALAQQEISCLEYHRWKSDWANSPPLRLLLS